MLTFKYRMGVYIELFLWNFYFWVPLHEQNQRHLRLKQRQMLSYTCTGTCTEANVSKGMQIVTLSVDPSFRSELHRFFVEFLAVMTRVGLEVDSCSFSYTDSC